MTNEIALRDEVVLVGGSHDGNRMNIPEGVNEIRLPLMHPKNLRVNESKRQFDAIEHERYLRFVVLGVTNCFVHESLDEAGAFRALLNGYKNNGAVKLQVINCN